MTTYKLIRPVDTSIYGECDRCHDDNDLYAIDEDEHEGWWLYCYSCADYLTRGLK
jgi:hypothetical protein